MNENRIIKDLNTIVDFIKQDKVFQNGCSIAFDKQKNPFIIFQLTKTLHKSQYPYELSPEITRPLQETKYFAYYLLKNDDNYEKIMVHSANIIYPVTNDITARLATICVKNELGYHKGIGSTLLKLAQDDMKKRNFLYMDARFFPFSKFINDNAALKFYSKLGFKFPFKCGVGELIAKPLDNFHFTKVLIDDLNFQITLLMPSKMSEKEINK